MVIFSVGSYALTGAIPHVGYALVFACISAIVGVRTYRSEKVLAEQEDQLLLETHWERYRAYLQRRRVWSRLRYCGKCGLVVDPVTQQTTSLFDVHELANSRVKSVSLR